MNHPVEIAVAPLKADAISRAEKSAVELIAKCKAELAAVDNDRNATAPYPDSGKLFGNEWHIAHSRYKLFSFLSETRSYDYADRSKGICRADITPEREARFIAMAKDDAAVQYDAFVAKLVAKIGACDTAELTGNHVWSWSILLVKKGAAVESWKTTQIVNVSKLGKIFNQWPSRKQK